MRLTLKFLVKSFLFIVLLLFLMPLLLSQIDSAEEEKAAQLRKRADAIRNKIKKKDLGFKEDLERLRTSMGGKDPPYRQHGIEAPQDKVPVQVPQPPQGVMGAQVGHAEHKEFGPKAVLHKGVTGNFEPVYVAKSGPGENGEAVYTSMEEKAKASQSVREYGFNMVVSDKIAMDRNIPDTRIDECKFWQYPEDLPTASVILVFHNEGLSTLMRTVHSVINTSPKHLLKEVVMVDDFSDKAQLKGPLDKYLQENFPPGLVKLHHNTERLGLIGTRTNGARYAMGDVIVFLDAHCECNRNWLVPLLARIKYDRTIMAVPTVDSINWDTFKYRSTYGYGGHFRGIFEWGFLYKESQVPQRELKKREHDSEPYWAPTHAGGLFAMDREYFFELGGYDPGLMIWGGENFELSFKIWQCGGSIEWVPCSRVGHVYRNSMPYGFGKISPKIPIILLNYMRVVEVWLDDEYKEYFYTREPTIRGYPIGNITDQLAFKKAHNCKSFKWFMDNIAYEVLDKFPVPPPNKAWGEIKQKGGSKCWDSMGQGIGGGNIGFSSCHHLGGNQLFRLNVKGQMAVGERCVDSVGGGIQITYCGVQPSGPWHLDDKTGLFKHNRQNKCVQLGKGNVLSMESCDHNNQQQVWEMNQVRTW